MVKILNDDFSVILMKIKKLILKIISGLFNIDLIMIL